MNPLPAAFLCSASLCAVLSAAQSPSSTLTPGQVLLLANSAGAAAKDALTRALTSDDPHVRLAAGRVMGVEPEIASAPALIGALAREQDPHTGAELVRDLLFVSGTSAVSVVDPQARRLGPEAMLVLAEWQARKEPQELAPRLADLVAFPQLDGFRLGRIVAFAANQHPERRNELLRTWMSVAPADSWTGLLDLLDLSGAPSRGDEVLQEALRSDHGTVRLETVWFVLSQLARKAHVSSEVLDLVASPAASDSSPWETFGRELAARRRDHAAADHSELIRSEGAKHISWVETAVALGQLTAAERNAAASVVPSSRSPLPARSARVPARTIPPIISGEIADVLRSAGCRPGDPKLGVVATAYAAAGRPVRLEVDPTGLSSSCVAAVTALARTTVAGLEDGGTPEATQWLALPLTDQFASCPGLAVQAEQRPMQADVKVRQPRKIKDVKPVYPQSAQAKRISGVVVIEATISATGCVNSARVVRSIPELDFASLAAVTQWQFTPTMWNDQPVPVLMTVTVNFTLR